MIDPRFNAANDYRDRHVLITGAFGFIGSRIVEMLPETCRITRISRRVRANSVNSSKVRDVSADVRDPETWLSHLPGVDVVLHLAGQTSVTTAASDPSSDLLANTTPILHLLEACKRGGHRPAVVSAGTVTQAGIPRSLPVDEDHPDHPVTAYDLHKLLAEQYLAYGARTNVVRGVTLRLANVYGPGPEAGSPDRGILNQMIGRALAGQNLRVYGSGDQRRDYVFIDDVARAFLLAGSTVASLNGSHFVIATGIGTSLRDAFDLVSQRVARATGRRVAIEHVDHPLQPIDARDFVGACTRFRDATGWQPITPLADGIDACIGALTNGRDHG